MAKKSKKKPADVKPAAAPDTDRVRVGSPEAQDRALKLQSTLDRKKAKSSAAARRKADAESAKASAGVADDTVTREWAAEHVAHGGPVAKPAAKPGPTPEVDDDGPGAYNKMLYAKGGRTKTVKNPDEEKFWKGKGYSNDPVEEPSSHGHVYGAVNPLAK